MRTPKQVNVQLSELAMKSPLHDHVGNAPGLTSLASVHQLATEKAKVGAQEYQKKIINYATEWEHIVTTRVDEDMKNTNALHVTLNHYENKVDTLRKKVNAVENRGKESPSKLSEKLTRNEDKLKEAWKVHEESASRLCNLLDEITTGGWKDLYPLVTAALQWEVGRATGEHDVYGKLSEVEKGMTATFDEKASVPVVEQRAERPPAAVASEDGDSDTTGSFHPPDVVSVSSSDDGDHHDVKAAESPKVHAV
jgi:septal ring factor EnvC (AmiA/AmiB activator)